MSNSILLYRYLDAEAALKSIEGRRLKVGRLRDFNDPFEWRIGVTGIVPEGEIVARTCVDSIIDELHSEFGIICFSQTSVEPVLWSHYASNHRGVAFEVSYLLDPERLHKVEYSEDRPVLDANRLNDQKGVDEYLRPLVFKLIFQKSSGWAYEKEYRVHVALPDCEIQHGFYFKRIPEQFLTRVILGFRCPLEEGYVRKALDHAGLETTQVVRAKMDEHSYKIRS